MQVADICKKIAFSNRITYGLLFGIQNFYLRHFKGGRCTISNKGYARIKKDVVGEGNEIFVESGATLHDVRIRIRGNNNTIVFGKNCYVGTGCSFWMEGDNISIVIGESVTFTYGCHFCAQEDNSRIEIGKDCMFSNSITVRTSDSHPIYSMDTTERMNKAGDVLIGNHVWIAPNTKIMKGVVIQDGSIIGSDTIVTKNIPPNVLAVGHPAHIVKENICWTREKLF